MEFFGYIFLVLWFIWHLSMLNLNANVKHNYYICKNSSLRAFIPHLENAGVDQMLPKGLSSTCVLWFMYFGHCISLSVYYKLKKVKKDNIKPSISQPPYSWPTNLMSKGLCYFRLNKKNRRHLDYSLLDEVQAQAFTMTALCHRQKDFSIPFILRN